MAVLVVIHVLFASCAAFRAQYIATSCSSQHQESYRCFLPVFLDYDLTLHNCRWFQVDAYGDFLQALGPKATDEVRNVHSVASGPPFCYSLFSNARLTFLARLLSKMGLFKRTRWLLERCCCCSTLETAKTSSVRPTILQ